MPTSLVIVESPAKCKKIETYLGPGYKVIASFGHLRTIAGLKDIDVKNNFLTKYSIIQEELKLKQIEKIRTEITNADDVIIATDDDREGEANGWHICDLFGLSVTTTKRIIFHEITEQSIQIAIAHPKRINVDMVHAQQARQILDLLVGFTVSPILWNCVSKTHDSSLSAGRCQTPALRLVYDNYLDIKASPGKLVYNTSGYFTNLNILFEINTQFSTNDEVKTFLEKCKYWDFICNITLPKNVIKKYPEPLTTASLQQLASNELHMSPTETMKCAQTLYECGYITYMRTDTKKYSQEFIDNVKKFINEVYGEQYISQTINNLAVGKEENIDLTKTIAEKRGIPKPQEAHEAIRPVNINVRTIVELSTKTISLYNLIWKRTIESCMPSAQYNSICAKISAPNSEFVHKTEQPIFLGWQIIEPIKHENNYQYISTLKQNISMKPKKIDSKFTINDLKPHYTEARLVQLLEEKGIGRPSNFASLIDKIQERKYVEKQTITGKDLKCSDYSLLDDVILETITHREFGNEKNKLVIQPLGIMVIEFLISKFDLLFNYDYTKQMEDCLDLIATGKTQWNNLCDKCYKELTNITKDVKEFKNFSIEVDNKHTLIIGKHGPVVKCVKNSNEPKKITFLPVKTNLDLEELTNLPNLSLEDVLDNLDNDVSNKAIGKYKGDDLFIKKGKYGVYAQWGKETKSLKGAFSGMPIDKFEYINVLRFLDKDVLDPSKPVGLVRELNTHLSIKHGKYGDYIFYKKPRAKKPEFFKLNEFGSDYKTCDKMLILNWIKQTYNIE